MTKLISRASKTLILSLMRILSLNTQKAFHPLLSAFMKSILESGVYDFILLQEVDEKVLSLIRNTGPYQLLQAFDEIMGAQSHLCIIYRDTFTLKKSSLDSFGRMHPSPPLQHPGFGMLLGTFRITRSDIQVGSVHLHSGLRPSVRAREVIALKQSLLKETDTEIPLVVGGDFNLGFPGEVKRACDLMSPEFIATTRRLGPTLDSRYSEPHPNIVNSSAVFLAKLGIGLRFKTDHLFADVKTAKRSRVHILSDRVSDHSPLELTII